ncbi:glycoside hydrolase superfamily [Calycina marina]|uniref:alpha-amylase n=1 Tax=Calycina marina TaxID=1763456 RepID=A0A9P7ZAL9_9HELO|nr:glycoside hydrolase superfamily [Calycina marina]
MISAWSLSRTLSASWARSSQFLALFLSLTTIVNGTATVNDWRAASIYQLITDRFGRADNSTTAPCNVTEQVYCGGTWQGVINHLDYIQGMGFTAIWISPITSNINGSSTVGESYHGFWPNDINTLNSNFGTADDLKALSTELHSRGMLLMVDVVANNMASAAPGATTDYTQFTPFDKEDYFHSFCWIDDYTLASDYQNCWLGSDDLALPDLDSENEFVISTFQEWAVDVIANYSIDGFRIDAAKHVPKAFWAAFQDKADVYTVGEWLTADASQACDYEVDALVGVLNYPMWYSINATFTNSDNNLTIATSEFESLNTVCQDTTLLGTFTENQDQPRLGYYTQDNALLLNALAWALLADGIPILYYGAEAKFDGLEDPLNRESLWLTGYQTDTVLYTGLAAMNAARNAVAANVDYSYWSAYWTWKSKIIYSPGNIVAVRKGYDQSIVAIVTNVGSDGATLGPYTIEDTNFASGDVVVDTISCTTQTAGDYGYIKVTVTEGMPQTWIKTALLTNSTICPDVDRQSTTTTTESSASSVVASSLYVLLISGLAYSLSILL